MTFPWQRMTVEEFASFERSQGERIIKIKGVHWRRVRPCFYRPLLPFQEHQPEAISPPSFSWFGGFQHAVSPDRKGNSVLNALLFEETEAYSLESLNKSQRKEIKLAAREFIIRPVQDVNEFKVQAYPVYRSFYERTGYEYKSERFNRDCFCNWADSLLVNPKVVVLGAYRNNQLGAVSVTNWVENTIIYSMTFADAQSLRQHVTSLMLHSIREALAGRSQVKQMFIGMYNYYGRTSTHDFYLLRGCKLVRKPALLHINPVAKAFLMRFLPEQYARLVGDIKERGNKRAVKNDVPPQAPVIRAISGETKAVELGRVIPLR